MRGAMMPGLEHKPYLLFLGQQTKSQPCTPENFVLIRILLTTQEQFPLLALTTLPEWPFKVTAEVVTLW